ncbi:lactonase family protein [Portibacter lacus]|uniref:6-phosphogluconolactonase n=1 Tax=Portibacter lacus TaxID=1099794 RepID=A0AA37SMZ3_9BACT|nr:lactonase family protein [Portibacter lacus]GLR17371.1 6-phosphogluconolactonase [Portibacter lacus]
MKYIIYIFTLSAIISCETATETKSQDKNTPKTENMILFVGSYTDKEGHVDGQADGIYTLNFNPINGVLRKNNLSVSTTNPSYIHVDKEHKMIYAVNEKVGQGEGVSSFSYNQDSTTFINQLPAIGGAPCHLIRHKNHILTANYVGGNHAVYSLNSDGSLKKNTQSYQYKGKGLTPRQEAPHAHMITSNPHTGQLLGTDLGTDIITFFEFNESDGMLTKVSETKLAPGSGPRHVDFHSSKDIVYALNELDGSIDVLYKEDDAYISKQKISSTKDENPSSAGCAAIHIHPNGKYLYVSNRGDINSISVFQIDNNGALEMIEEVSTTGNGPRDFAIAPSGKFLLVGHQNSDNIVVFKIDEETGKLMITENTISVPTPVCLKFE